MEPSLYIGLGVGCAKMYYDHRQHVINDEHREDDLISSRIKKYSLNIYNNMSNNTPIEKQLEDIIKVKLEQISDQVIGEQATDIIKDDVIPVLKDFVLDNIYPDEKSDEEDKNDSEHKIIDLIPKLSTNKFRKSLIGFGKMKINDIIRSVTPSRLSHSETKEEIKLNTDFEEFCHKLIIFMVNEYKNQDLENAHLQKHKEYTEKLLLSLNAFANLNNDRRRRNK
jgi:hypothetical protein